jgi:hypothetical protein
MLEVCLPLEAVIKCGPTGEATMRRERRHLMLGFDIKIFSEGWKNTLRA